MRQKDGNSFIHDESPQEFFDAFNFFVMASDKKVFNKLISKHFFLEITKSVPGDVMELGVFRGSGMFSWIKMLNYFGINRRVYGFDIFDSDLLISGIETQDRNVMSNLFQDRGFNPSGYQTVLEAKLKDSGFYNFDLITGDIFDTIPEFLGKNPGFRAAVINFDMDTDEPTYFALEKLWDRLVVGGVMVFDEYAINEWTESDAVDRFIRERNLQIRATHLSSPSAYIVK